MRLSPISTLASGEYTSRSGPAFVVCDDQQLWSELWEEHTRDESPAPSQPRVDFNQYVVVAVFGGERPTSGYTLQIREAILTTSDFGGNVLRIRYFIRLAPGPRADVITNPYHIVTVPRAEWNEVSFEEMRV